MLTTNLIKICQFAIKPPQSNKKENKNPGANGVCWFQIYNSFTSVSKDAPTLSVLCWMGSLAVRTWRTLVRPSTTPSIELRSESGTVRTACIETRNSESNCKGEPSDEKGVTIRVLMGILFLEFETGKLRRWHLRNQLCSYEALMPPIYWNFLGICFTIKHK